MHSAALSQAEENLQRLVEDGLYVMATFLVRQVILRFVTSPLGEGEGK